ncbi:hypothetical protein IW262DRAFT_1412484 [Armillaria fumosa]|nr:hypothetical protein IW262DRAFT_1412484 [Armillaria fumosa]
MYAGRDVNGRVLWLLFPLPQLKGSFSKSISSSTSSYAASELDASNDIAGGLLRWWTADLGCCKHHVLVVYIKNDGCFQWHDQSSHWE